MADLPGAPARRDPILAACVIAAALGATAAIGVLGWMIYAAVTGWSSILSMFRLLILAGA